MLPEGSLPRRSFLQCAALALAGCSAPPGAAGWGIAGLGTARGLAVAAGHLFVVDDSAETVGGAVLLRAPLGGGLARAVAYESHGIVGAAVSAVGVVWSARRSGELRTATHANPAAARLVAARPGGFFGAMATDGTDVFASSLDGGLAAFPLDGGPARALFAAPATALALAPGAVVFFAGDAVRVVPRGGGPAAVLAPAREVVALVVRGEHAYWIERAQPRGARTGSLRRAPLAGGAAETLAAGLDDPAALAVGEARAWYAGSSFEPSARRARQMLGRVELAGGRHRRDDSPVGVTDLLCDGDALYVAGAIGAKVGRVVRRQPA